MWIRYLLASSTLLLALPSWAACNASALNLDVVSQQQNYDILTNGNYTLTNTYQLSTQFSGSGCTLVVMLETEDGDRALKNTNNHGLKFDWYGRNGVQKANQWHVTLNDDTPSITFQLRYPSLQWLNSGRYQADIEASVVTGNLNNLANLAPRRLSLEMNVLPVTKIQFYGLAQSHYDLDMGTLYSNKVIRSAPKLWVRTNTGYTVTIESTHQGNLRHQSNDPQWDILYALLFDDKQIDLRQSQAHIHRHSPTSGSSIPLQFTIGETENKPGGKYSDTLQISIEPQLSQSP